MDEKIHDVKFETKPTTFFKDAFRRFRKNRSSVTAGIIIGILITMAVIVPLASQSNIDQSFPQGALLPPRWPGMDGVDGLNGTKEYDGILMDVSDPENPLPAPDTDTGATLFYTNSIGSRQFSGTGGQSDTAVGAQNSKNGRSFIALYSTAMVRNKQTGERVETSKIVAQLKPGAAVSLSRNDVHYVVTEYGVANLRGKNIQERVEALVAIAHPKFRDQLLEDAIRLGIYVPKGQ